MRCYITFITGMMIGFELAEDDDSRYVVIDLFILQFLFERDK